MTCVTCKAGNRHTTRHHQRESPAPESARQKRYTNPLHTASAGRRHTFAVSTLIDAHRQGRDVDACIAVLSTHLGHVTPAHTFWYLTITPALADAVSERAALYYQGGLFR